MDTTAFEKSLKPFIPEPSVIPVFRTLLPYKVKLKVTKERTSKHGDYRPPLKDSFHQISVNGNLNNYAFLITLLHEIAHLLAFQKTKSLKNPHGKAWKDEFKTLLMQHIELNSFPTVLLKDIKKYATNPKASSASDANLFLGLKKFDQNQVTTLHDIESGQFFLFRNKIFRKDKIRRTRVLCTEMSSGKQYLISKIAEITLQE